MKNAPVYVFSHHPSIDNKSGLLAHSENPVLAKVMEERRRQLGRRQNQYTSPLERIILESRFLIVEGISGSGKDTFQTYLKNLIKGREIHDYSEGEVLQSWNQLQIEGIAKVRVKFMKLFIKYVENTLSDDKNAVFILNRFHLSAYVMTIIQHPKLQREYDEIIEVMRALPIHVFVMQMDENEIEQRSLHPERSAPWHKFQQEIVKKDGFRNRVERYVWQQNIMVEAAERQKIPYSIIRAPSLPTVENAHMSVAETGSILRRVARKNVADESPSEIKRGIPRTL